MRRHFLVGTITGQLVAAASIVLLACIATAGEAKKERDAVSAAEKWLSRVDEGKYTESWKEAAGYFRNAINQEQWVQSLQAVRKPLGKLLSRSVKAKTYKASLPGAPNGEYVVVQFEASLEHKKAAIETVTPILDNDGIWRVSGYYIK